MIVLIYLLKTLFCSAIFYGYYSLVLRDKAFHRYNRYYLLLTPALAVLLPLLKLPVDVDSTGGSGQLMQTLQVINFSGWEQNFIVRPQHSFFQSMFESQEIYYLLYLLGSLIVLFPLIASIGALSRLAKKYQAESLGKIRFYNTDEPDTPFSFFRTIFWNREISLESVEGRDILRHEMFHVSQKHSFDLVYLELMKSLFWFNPFFYFTRRELHTIHEFLADQHASSQTNKYVYAELLVVQAVEKKQMNFYHHFFNTEIKRRIVMITKTQMNRYNYFRRAMALPLAFIIFCAFSLNLNCRGVNPLEAPSKTHLVPMSELMKIDFASVESFSINDKTVLLTMKDKKTMLVEKKVYDEYLALNNKNVNKAPEALTDQNGDKIFTETEIHASYPGDKKDWLKYMNKTFKYPQEAVDKEIQGPVVVQFIVDEDGNLSDIHAVEGTLAGGLREEAVRVIRSSGKWSPAVQNGKAVKSYSKQTITFRLDRQ